MLIPYKIINEHPYFETDPETTMDALVSAADTPMSVIIIGIGDEDFTIMEKFDSDEKLLKSRSKRRASRDIVQFVGKFFKWFWSGNYIRFLYLMAHGFVFVTYRIAKIRKF